MFIGKFDMSTKTCSQMFGEWLEFIKDMKIGHTVTVGTGEVIIHQIHPDDLIFVQFWEGWESFEVGPIDQITF